MKNEIMIEIASCAIRWSNNILTEILSNYGSYIPLAARNDLRDAIKSLVSAADLLRIEILKEGKE